MIAFLILVLACFGGLVCLVYLNEKTKADESAEARRLAREIDDEYQQNRKVLVEQLFGDWPFHAGAMIDHEIGFVAMDANGKNLRLVSCKKDGTSIAVKGEETIRVGSITSLDINQPMKEKIVSHVETTPVAVGSKRSPVGRAVVGGLIAGPAGAMVGGMSGLGGKSKIEHVQTSRQETVMVKGHPKLVIGVDDLARPRRVFEFPTVSETNEWPSRIHAAMNRRG